MQRLDCLPSLLLCYATLRNFVTRPCESMLESQPQAELNAPRSVHLCQRDDTELTRRRARVGAVESRRIECIECLGAELRPEALPDLKRFEERQVELRGNAGARAAPLR